VLVFFCFSTLTRFEKIKENDWASMEIQQESFGEKLNEVYVLYFFVI
jgi:hypothetical protein